MPNLPLKETLGAPETNVIHRAVAAALKVRLYFNAESYINKPMYEEAAKICQDIIDGKYGQYKLANHFTEIFGGVMRLARRLSGQYLPRMPKVRRMVV